MENIPQIPDEFHELLTERYPDGFTLRDEANAIVAYAFRNGPIEDLHAGKPSKLLKNKDLSRITDAEMKKLMISASEKIEALLSLKETDPAKYTLFVRTYNLIYFQGWER